MTKPTEWNALASYPRRMILMSLAEGEKTVTELTQILRLTQPTISQHLGILRDAGLISGRSVPRPEVGGAWRAYRLEPEGLARMHARYDYFLGDLQQRALLQVHAHVEEDGSVALSTQ